MCEQVCEQVCEHVRACASRCASMCEQVCEHVRAWASQGATPAFCALQELKFGLKEASCDDRRHVRSRVHLVAADHQPP